jgi:DNA-binding GntR family transcriptional regulator
MADRRRALGTTILLDKRRGSIKFKIESDLEGPDTETSASLKEKNRSPEATRRRGRLPSLGQRRTVGELTYQAIRAAIVARRLKPGTRLVVDDLAEELSVSRTPVKEALGKLEREGLVVMHPHRGARVATITMRDIEEIYALREVVEGLAARLAAQAIDQGDIARLRSLIEEGQEALAAQDYHTYADVDLRFHGLIRRASGNQRLQRIMESLDGQIHILITTSAAVPGRGTASVDEHRRVVEALEAGDPRAAEEAMRAHVAHARAAILAHWGGQEESGGRESAGLREGPDPARRRGVNGVQGGGARAAG